MKTSPYIDDFPENKLDRNASEIDTPTYPRMAIRNNEELPGLPSSEALFYYDADAECCEKKNRRDKRLSLK